MNMGHMRCLGPLEAPIEWKSDELCGRNQTRQCRGWFPDGRRVRSMAFAKGSGTDLCTSDSVIRQMTMMMDKSGRRHPPLTPRMPRTGSNPPSESRGDGNGVGRGAGCGVGRADGSGVGLGVGSPEGAGVGRADGSGVGLGEGSGEGFGVGMGPMLDGTGVGLGVGRGEGAAVGMNNGAGVGTFAGRGVGCGVGRSVGAW